MGIILSSDSLCDLTEEIKKENQIHTISYHIILDEKDYIDGRDISPDELFRAYQERDILPRTAAVNVGEYVSYFQPWIEQGHEIIHFCLGSSLTSSYQNCLLAAETLGHITVIDSGSLSGGIGLQLLDCRQMIDAGKTPAEIARYFEENRAKYHASFVLDTLDFLRAGGRCSALVALSACLLSIKPEIVVNPKDGSMSVGNKFRGNFEKVVGKYVKHKLEQYPDMKTDKIILAYAGPEHDMIDKVYQMVKEANLFEKIYIIRASCTICSHCGPGTIGIFLETESNCA